MRIGVRHVGTRAWAQAVIRGVESDAVKRVEAHPAEDVEMDLTGTAITLKRRKFVKRYPSR